MKKNIRLGVWGCGHGVDGHAVVVRHTSGVELVALCDKKRQALIQGCDKINYPVSRFMDPEEMFPHIDAVIIATLDEDHITHLKMALDRNLHVLIEKPVAITRKDMSGFKELLQAAQSKGLVVTSCHPRRFDPPFMWLKKKLPSLIKRFGKVTSFHYDFTYHRPKAGWKQISRSLLLDHHGHEIDLVSFLFGCVSFDESMHDDSADRYLVTGRRTDGISFSFHGTRHLEDRLFREWMTVRFENGSVMVNSDTGIATLKNHVTKKTSSQVCGETNYSVRSLGVTKNFIDTIRGKTNNYLTVEDMILNNESGIYLLDEGNYAFVT